MNKLKIGDKCRLGTGWNKNNEQNPFLEGFIVEILGRYVYVNVDGNNMFATISGLIHPQENKYLIESRTLR